MQVLQVNPSVIAEGINLIWIFVCAALVFFMHAGFGMLEAGQVRSKNVSNQLTKNLLIWGTGIVVYFIVGGGVATIAAAITTGGSFAGAFDYINSGPPSETSLTWASWLFGGMFAVTTASVVSGAVGGRAKLRGFVLYSLFVSSLIYPVASGLTWGGGILGQIGYSDFTGSGVVHMVSGVAALTAAYVIGPRIDRFNDDGSANIIPGHSVIFTVLGGLILGFGWFGFNLGTATTVFVVEDGSLILDDFSYIGRVAVNTALVTGVGALGAALYSLIRGKKVDPVLILNGLLAGLVAVCAIASTASWWGTLIVGFIAGAQVSPVYRMLERFGIDDVCAVFPVHGTAGLLGVLAVPFVDTTTAFSFAQLGSQIVGAIVLTIWAAGATGIVFGGLRLIDEARVSREHEIQGLDQAEHNVVSYPEFGQNAGGSSGPMNAPIADGGKQHYKSDGGSKEKE